MCTEQEFAEFVAGMKCIYTMPTFLPDLESIKVWYVPLQHFCFEDLKRAFASYYPVNTLPPVPADLIRLLKSPTHKTGISAWSEVLRAIRKYGPQDGRKASESVDVFTNDIVNGIGGWEVIRNCPPSNMAFLMKQFVSAYEDCVQRETVRLLPDAMRQTMIGHDGNYMIEG